MGDLLKVEGIDASYGDLKVLNGLSLDVEKGEVVALLGGNGVGKTTTLRAISGLIRPSKGRILFCGEDITSVPAHQLPERGIVHVPEGRCVFRHMSVRENLELGAYPRRVRARMQKNIAAVFDLFPVLAERQETAAGLLSGGQQQMLAIARGLMAEPQLLLLDEPSLGLAPAIVTLMFETVERVRNLGITVLLVEQNLWETLEVADRYYLMATGSVISQGSTKDLTHDTAFKEAYLGA